jgi:hypothetical protein
VYDEEFASLDYGRPNPKGVCQDEEFDEMINEEIFAEVEAEEAVGQTVTETVAVETVVVEVSRPSRVGSHAVY